MGLSQKGQEPSIVSQTPPRPARGSGPFCYTQTMLRSLWSVLRPAIFWSYKRGSWQYDVMVALILVFIFVTPRSWFRDQPRSAGAQHIVMLPSEEGRAVFW